MYLNKIDRTRKQRDRERQGETGRQNNKADRQLEKKGAERVNSENSLYAVCFCSECMSSKLNRVCVVVVHMYYYICTHVHPD